MSWIPGPRVDVTLKRASRVKDSFGTYTATFNTIGTINGVFTQLNAKESKAYEKDTIRRLYVLYADPGTVSDSMTENDRITKDSLDYNIVSVRNPFEQTWFYRVILERTGSGS